MFTEAEKFYIDCPYSEKNACKALGGKWDGNAKSWYIPEGLNHSNFTRWIQIRAYHVRTGNKHCPQALDKRIKASEMGRLIKPGQVAQLLSSTIKQAMELIEDLNGPKSKFIGSTRYWERDLILNWINSEGL